MISSLVTNNWITILFIIMIGLLVLVNYLFEKQFSMFKKFFQMKQYLVAYASITTVLHPFNIIFLLFQVLSYGLLFLKLVEYSNELIEKNQLLLFIKVCSGILIFYILRYLIGSVLASILNLKKQQDGFSFMKITHLAKVSLIIFPFLILIHYFEFKNGLLYVILGIFTALILFIKYINILFKYQKSVFGNLFYFILYLCTLEILPLVLVFKTFFFKN